MKVLVLAGYETTSSMLVPVVVLLILNAPLLSLR
jgi:hypothetical protein